MQVWLENTQFHPELCFQVRDWWILIGNYSLKRKSIEFLALNSNKMGAKIHENFNASKTWQWTFLRQYNDGLELLKLPRLNWHKNTVENKTASSAHSWEKDGPVIGALDSESRILCSRPGQVKVLCPLTKKFTFRVPLSNQ